MKVWLALLGTLPLLAVGSGATASNSAPPRNGLIAVQGAHGIYIVDPRTETARVVPKSEELSDPAWSPDATTLAVTSARDDSYDVYTMKPDSSERTLVLRDAFSPSWSPDGKQLVVVRRPCGSTTSTIPCGVTTLAIVNADGTDVRELGHEKSAFAPEWSPDGKLIAFVDDSGRVGLITPDGERVPAPTTPMAGGMAVSWSPDSSKLAYDRYEGEHEVAIVFDRSTGKETILPGNQRGAEAPAWSPEGDQLVFNSMDVNRSTATATCGEHLSSHLWLMAPDGTKAHPLGKGLAAYGPASWARAADTAPVLPPAPAPTEKTTPPNPTVNPTGSTTPPAGSTATALAAPARLVGKASAKEVQAPTAATGAIAVRGEDGIYLVHPASAKAHKVPGTADMSAPAWSPDANLLAVEKSEKGGGTSIYTIRRDGTHAQLVMENASAPSWSTDGERILAVHGECAAPCDPEDDAAQVLYSARLDGSDVQRVGFEDADAYDARELVWPTDGLASHFFDEESLIGPGNFDSRAATWSPDGTVLAFTDVKTQTGLWVVSADGGRPHLLLSGASGRPSWVSS